MRIAHIRLRRETEMSFPWEITEEGTDATAIECKS